MFIRLTFLNFLPGKAEEASRLYVNQVAPSIRMQEGLVNVLLMHPENETDDYISCTMWQSRENAEAYQAGEAYKKDFSQIRDLTSKPPAVKFFTVP